MLIRVNKQVIIAIAVVVVLAVLAFMVYNATVLPWG